MNKNCQNLNSRYGFTLVETMTSLMVFSIAIAIIFLVLQGLHREFKDSYASEFYLYLNVIENHGYKLRDYYPHRLDLVKGRKKYIVKFIDHKLIMSTNRGGYSPLLDNVKAVNWGERDGALISNVQMMSGEHFNGKSYLNEK